MAYRPLPPAEYLRSRLEYAPASGVLTWRHRASARSTWNTRFAGQPAGHYSPERGYCTVRIDGVLYLAHRVIWAMLHGDIASDVQIDHWDLNRGNNRQDNLRLATQMQNSGNTRARSTSATGIKGVSLHRASGLWRARLTVHGKETCAYFRTPEAAAAAYAAAAAEHFGEFARAA